jgi:O-antigen ligase
MRNTLGSRTEQGYRSVTVGLLALGACSLAWNQFGSILTRDWLPYAVVAALLTAGLLWSSRAQRPSRPALVGIAALIGLAAWDALSLRWSPVPALARDEALLVVFYALVFSVPLLVLRHESDRTTAASVVIGFLVALAVATILNLLLVAHPTDDYENGRLTYPISYVNAQAALFLIGFWPCVALAARRSAPVAFRGAAVGGSCALLAGWLMTQSKGGAVALALAGIVFFAINPERLRAVVPATVPLALVGGTYLPLTRPFRERNATDFADAIRSAATTALILVAVAAALGLCYAWLDGRIRMSARAARVLAVLLATGAAAAVAASVVTFFVAVDRPGHYLHGRWESFKRLPKHESGSSHLTSLGSNRYDFWRVEVNLARDHALAGVGARGFGAEYLIHRRSSETPERGHSLELDTLSETGVVGLVLLVAAVGVPLGAALVRSRRTGLLAGLAAACTYCVLHMSIDWVWTVPAIGALFFLLLGIANAGTTGDRPPQPLLGKRVLLVSGLAVLAMAIGGFGLPWLSTRLTAAGLRHQKSAAADFRWARRLDPLSVDPLLAEAAAASSPEAAIRPLRRAVAMQPRNSSVHLSLGRALLRSGDRAGARRELLLAQRLDPHDPLIARALRAAGF